MSEKPAEDVLYVRYDGSVGQKAAATRSGFGSAEWFEAREVKPLEADWARQLVQTGHFDLCLQRKEAAKRFGLTLKAYDKLEGLTLADVVVANDEAAGAADETAAAGESDEPKPELPAVQFVVLDTKTRRILAKARRDAAKSEEG